MSQGPSKRKPLVETARRSDRKRRKRVSEDGTKLLAMGFSQEMVEEALEKYTDPDVAVQWLLDTQMDSMKKTQNTQASPSKAQEEEGEDDLFCDLHTRKTGSVSRSFCMEVGASKEGDMQDPMVPRRRGRPRKEKREGGDMLSAKGKAAVSESGQFRRSRKRTLANERDTGPKSKVKSEGAEEQGGPPGVGMASPKLVHSVQVETNVGSGRSSPDLLEEYCSSRTDTITPHMGPEKGTVVTEAACATQLENSQLTLASIRDSYAKSQVTQIDTTQYSKANVDAIPKMPATQINNSQVSDKDKTFQIGHATPSPSFLGSAPEYGHNESPDLLALDDGSPYGEEHDARPQGTFSLPVSLPISKSAAADMQCRPVDKIEMTKVDSTQIDGVDHEACEADKPESLNENELSGFHPDSTFQDYTPKVNETPCKTPCSVATNKSQCLPSRTPFDEHFSRSQGYECSQPFDYDLSQRCDSSQNSEGRQVGPLPCIRQKTEQETPATARRGTCLNTRSSASVGGAYFDATLNLSDSKQPSVPTVNLNLEEEKERRIETYEGPQHRILNKRSISGNGGKEKGDRDIALLPDKESRKASGSSLQTSRMVNLPKSTEKDNRSVGLFQDAPLHRTADAGDLNNCSSDLAKEAAGTLFQTGRGRRIQVSDESLRKVESLFEENENRPVTEVSVSVPAIFQTGRGKKVHVSEDSIGKAAKLLEHQEAEPAAIFTNAPRNASSGPRSRQPLGVDGRPIMPVKVVNQNIPSGSRAQISSGQIGAAGHAPKFGSSHDSQEAQMKLGKAAGGDIEEPSLDLNRKEPRGSGVEELKHLDPFSPSRHETMSRERRDHWISDESGSTGFEGFFRTGKGQTVNITAESMEKIAHLFQEPSKSVISPATISYLNLRASSGSATQHNQNQEVSADIPSKPSEVVDPSIPKPCEMPSMTMFQTGRGRNIQVSEESLQKVAHIFSDNKTGEARDSRERHRTTTASKDMPALSMFQTGRGKSVTVSEESWRRVENLFNAEGQCNGAEGGVSRPLPGTKAILPNVEKKVEGGSSVTSMFQTGRGQALTVSEQSLRRADAFFTNEPHGGEEQVAIDNVSPVERTRLQDPEIHGPIGKMRVDGQQTNISRPSMFQTGKGRSLTVSEESLRRVDSLFSSQDQSEYRESRSSASEGPRQMSRPPENSEARKEASGVNVNIGSSMTFTFQTGRGREVAVSEESLRRSERFWEAGQHLAEGKDADAPRGISAEAGPVERAEHKEEGKVAARKDKYAGPPIPEENEQPKVICDTNSLLSSRVDSHENPMPSHLLSESNNVSASGSATPKKNNQDFLPECQIKDQVNAANPAFLLQSPTDSSDGIVKTPLTVTRRLRDLPRNNAGYSIGRLLTCGVSLTTVQITSLNAHLLGFNARGLPNFLYEPNDRNTAHFILPLPDATIRKLRHVFPANTIKDKWLSNHFRLIVWKLACMERAFPTSLGGSYLTESRVVKQLKYRYEREYERAERPALRKILNGDAPSTRLMILCVIQIFPQEKQQNPNEAPDYDIGMQKDEAVLPLRIQLTDGWYLVDALLDEPLTRLVHEGRIRMGGKLAISNAVMAGPKDGVEPLELMDEVEYRPYLKLSMNSTRRAKWDAKLGFQKTQALTVPIKSLVLGGGVVSRLEVVVMRRYPLLYLESVKGPNGTRSTRILTQAQEDEAERQHEAVCQVAMEKLSNDLASREKRHSMPGMPGGLYKRCEDPEAYYERLGAEEQKDLDKWLENYEHLQQANRMKMMEKELSTNPNLTRSSRPFFRVRICSIGLIESEGFGSAPIESRNKTELIENTAILTIWEPSDEFMDVFKEARHLVLHNVNVPKSKDEGTKVSTVSSRRLHSGKNFKIGKVSGPLAPPVLASINFEKREAMRPLRRLCDKFCAKNQPFVSREFDCCGLVLEASTWRESEQWVQGQNEAVRVTRTFFMDESRCLVCAERREYNFRLNSMAPKVEAGAVWAFSDLIYESYDRRTDTIMARFTVTSSIRKRAPSLSSSPMGYMRQAMEQLMAWSKWEDAKAIVKVELARLQELSRKSAAASDSSCVTFPSAFRETVCGYILDIEGSENEESNDAYQKGTAPVMCSLDLGKQIMEIASLTQTSHEILRMALQDVVGQQAEDGALRKDGAGTVASIVEELKPLVAACGGVLFQFVVQSRNLLSPSNGDFYELVDVSPADLGSRVMELLKSRGVNSFDFR